jgi:hypothetical protein
MDIAALSDNQCVETVPRSAHTTRDGPFQAVSAPASLIPQPNSAFLGRLRITDPVSQHSASLVVQTLRAFLQMMLRRQTFPPFIHTSTLAPSIDCNQGRRTRATGQLHECSAHVCLPHFRNQAFPVADNQSGTTPLHRRGRLPFPSKDLPPFLLQM